MALEEIDCLREGEYGGIANEDDGDGTDDDEQRLEVRCYFRFYGW